MPKILIENLFVKEDHHEGV